jgi:hypothetical protein
VGKVLREGWAEGYWLWGALKEERRSFSSMSSISDEFRLYVGLLVLAEET